MDHLEANTLVPAPCVTAAYHHLVVRVSDPCQNGNSSSGLLIPEHQKPKGPRQKPGSSMGLFLDPLVEVFPFGNQKISEPAEPRFVKMRFPKQVIENYRKWDLLPSCSSQTSVFFVLRTQPHIKFFDSRCALCPRGWHPPSKLPPSWHLSGDFSSPPQCFIRPLALGWCNV